MASTLARPNGTRRGRPDVAPTRLADPGHETPVIDPGDPAAAAVRAALAEGLYWLRVNTPRARAGEPEGVHHLRTTTRRLRSALGVFRGLTEPEWADRLAVGFKWLADALGAVRDLDVLSARLRDEAVQADAACVAALDPLFASLASRHAAATAALREALASDRFDALVGALVEAADDVPLAPAAWRPCREALPPLVRGVWKSLRNPARALSPDDPDDDFHDVRKRAKRARYAAEAVRHALDPGAARAARRFARFAREVQDVLGAHQDAVVAAGEFRRVAEAHPGLGPLNFAAGRLLEREDRLANESRLRFFEVWGRLDRKKNVRWLRP